MSLMKLCKKTLAQLGYIWPPERRRSLRILSNLQEHFNSTHLTDFDKIMLAYSGFIGGIALASLTPQASTNLQVILGSLAYWCAAGFYLYKCSRIHVLHPQKQELSE